ncbi:MAG: CbbQ/NirQ/NorQ/GpvN family protein [Candidatus Delongbacteria bacterium]
MLPLAVHESLPWYHPTGRECEVFEIAFQNRLPLMLKGPTGCGKTRLVEHMAARLGRPLVTVCCHDDTSVTDLLGRWLIRGGETVWQDGPATRALRQGAILYLDELIEARPDVITALHPLSDHRRRLFVERHDEEVEAEDGFMLVVSFNPGYTRGLKELKPSTRQRFLGISFDYPDAEAEARILAGETGIEAAQAKRLAVLGGKLRGLKELGFAEPASTRLLVNAARLIQAGMPPRLACDTALVEPLSDDPDLLRSLRDLVRLAF